jgi:hypothetical protein
MQSILLLTRDIIRCTKVVLTDITFCPNVDIATQKLRPFFTAILAEINPSEKDRQENTDKIFLYISEDFSTARVDLIPHESRDWVTDKLSSFDLTYYVPS